MGQDANGAFEAIEAVRKGFEGEAVSAGGSGMGSGLVKRIGADEDPVAPWGWRTGSQLLQSGGEDGVKEGHVREDGK